MSHSEIRADLWLAVWLVELFFRLTVLFHGKEKKGKKANPQSEKVKGVRWREKLVEMEET